MYASLGNIRFEKSKGFLEFNPTEGAVYAKIDLIGGKARLQKTGDELKGVEIRVRLHRGFTGEDLEKDIAAIRKYMADGEVLPLVDGAGNLYGNFVITGFSPVPESLYPDGRAISIVAGITLLEYIDPQPELTQARAARQNAFATSAAKVIPLQLLAPGTTADALTSVQVQSSTQTSLSAVADIRSVQSAPAQQATIFARAAAKIDAAKADAQAAIERIEQTATIAAKAPALLAQMQGMYAQILVMEQRISDGDLTNALTQATVLTDAASGISAALLPLNLSIILREA